jgi:YVTN family beta-propeller protein
MRLSRTAAIPLAVGAVLSAALWAALAGPSHADPPSAAAGAAAPIPAARPRYRSPMACAFTPDGRRLCVTFSAAGSVGIIDSATRAVVAEVPVGRGPRGIAVSPDGSTAWVALRDEGAVAAVDLRSRTVARRVEVGPYPEALALSADGRRAWVGVMPVGTYATVVEIDTVAGAAGRSFEVDRGVRRIVPTADGSRLVVSCDSHPPEGPPGRYQPVDRPEARSVCVVDLAKGGVLRKVVPDASNVRGVVVSPDGVWAAVVHQRPKSDRPVPSVTRGGRDFVEPETVSTGRLFTNGLTLISLDEIDEPVSVLLDEPGRFWADPCEAAWCQGGRTIAVTSSGGNGVLLIDAAKMIAAARSGRGGAAVSWAAWKGDSGYAGDEGLEASSAFVRARIAVPSNPRWGAVSPDGSAFWCCCTTDDSLAAVDLASATATRVPLGAEPADGIDEARRGERIFHDAAFCDSRAFSCASCHPDGGSDGLNWRLEGRRGGALNTKSLLGLAATEPFGWRGKSATLPDRAASTFRKTMGHDIAGPDAAAVGAYLATLEAPPSPLAPGGKLSEAAHRGRALFRTKAGCSSCHAGPRFTLGESRDVGTGAAFDVPSLRGVWQSAPYLHTGKAATLEDIWTRYDPDRRHGKARDLSPAEFADLMEYVKSL